MSALSYTECDIERSAVASARETFEELYSLITGRSGDYNTITTPVGFEFSDQIGEGLRTAANENQYAWSSSMLACLHAYGVLDKISADVKWYEDKIEEIKGDLSTALANSAEPDNLNIAQQIIESHNLQAEQAWRDLETRCDESQDMLKEGPTPENIRALGDGGYFGNNDNIGFYTTGDFDYYVVDEGQAGVIATHLGHAVLDGNEISIELLEDNPEYLALVAAVVSRGLLAQQNGDRLLGGEVEFLETLFGDLDEIGGDSPGFLQFMDQVNSSEHISDSLREDINRNLANSMLILSDEDIGGGMDRIPEDVRVAVEGPDFTDLTDGRGYMPIYNEWSGAFSDVSSFLSHSGPGVRGGADFSATMLATSARMLPSAEHLQGNPPIGNFEDIIDVASRNNEANYIILTGEDLEGNSYEFNELNEDMDPARVLEVFYTFDWEDDGETVSSITDWIDDYQESEDPGKSQMGSDAFLSLFDTVTSPEMQEILNKTGHSIEDEELGVTWRDVSFGHLNPEIAVSFADLFLANIDAMESPAGFNITGGEDPSLEEIENGYNRHGELRFDPEARLAFTQYIMADEESAVRLHSASFFRTEEGMASYFGDFPPDRSQAREPGILKALIDMSLENEHESRVDATNGAIDYRNKVMSGSVDLAAAVISDIDITGTGTAAEVMKIAFKSVLEENHVELARDDSGDFSPMALENRAVLHAAISLEEQGVVKIDGVDDMRDPETGRISLDPKLWVDQTDGGEEQLEAEEVIENIDTMHNEIWQSVWPGSSAINGKEVVEDFTDVYGNAYRALK
ncbi:TPR repeat region-containing protein [Nocardiopsis dassonvillei]|uniref:TPR repeat region-containing protein n=1 Tax=Nocardiopsis dassonvillei TaxID=2014 RepID=UPI00363339A9